MNYVEIIRNVLRNGHKSKPTRLENGKVVPVENGTIATFAEVFRHDMSKGFPLTTIRKMPWKSIRVELEGFIKGVRSKKWFQERGCKFWDQWAAPAEVARLKAENPSLTDKEAKLLGDDLGPIYGVMWRNFGGVDQLANVVNTLKQSPEDRRMIVSAWNPPLIPQMALPPCHYEFKVDVIGGKVNLAWSQRSVDLLLGLPSNIASYALLLTLLAEEANLPAGELVGYLSNCHIYDNHMEAAKELAERNEQPLPTLVIDDSYTSIFEFYYHQVQLYDYKPLPALKVGDVTV